MGNVILGLLMLAPATLYSLRKQFESTISLFYSASLGSLGTALAALHDRGLVVAIASVDNGRSKKTFTITDSGRAAFRSWMLEPVTQRDFETTALSRLFFLGLLSADERALAMARIRERQQADEATLREVAGQLDSMAISGEFGEIFFYQRQVLEYGLGSHNFAGAFFAQIAERLDDPLKRLR